MKRAANSPPLEGWPTAGVVYIMRKKIPLTISLINHPALRAPLNGRGIEVCYFNKQFLNSAQNSEVDFILCFSVQKNKYVVPLKIQQ